jgi:hypothetical protein
MDDLSATLRDRLNKLGQPVGADRLKRLTAQAEHGRDDTWRELDAILDCPWLTALEREAVWKASRSLAARLHAETAALDLAEDQAGEHTRPSPEEDKGRAVRRERELALGRAGRAIARIRLEKPAGVRNAEEALTRVTAQPADASAWRTLRNELRQTWVNNGRPGP